MTKHILITGASRGIGAATARVCAARGWTVSVNHPPEAGAEAEAAEVVEACRAAGARAQAFAGDMSVDADVAALWDAAEAAFGPVEGFSNNAGITGPTSALADMDPDRIRRVIGLNVIGAIMGAREAARRMPTDRGGRGGAIVNLASIAATSGAGGAFVDYGASKGAMVSLTKGLAVELAAGGVRVNGVRPGIIDTAIHADSLAPERVSQAATTVPMGRPGTAEEVARVIAWLMSEEASYVSGALVDVAGGR